MKKVLIFYGSYGAGHLSAARSIKECIDTNYKNIETKMVDCIEYINKLLNKISTKTYDELSKKAPWAWEKVYCSSQSGHLSQISNRANAIMAIKLNKLIQNYNPDLIISTHPFSTQMCGYLKKKGKINCKIATILTDYAPHNQWLVHSDYIDYYFVAHYGMKLQLEKTGIPESKVFATGIPLSNRFLAHYNKEEILKQFGLSKDKKTVLFFAGGSSHFTSGNTYEIFESFIESFPNLQLLTITGHNPKLKKHFDELVEVTDTSSNVKVLSFTDKVPELMSVSDLVITKPGGLTTTESLASGLPIIVINPIPGQEEENAQFLQDQKVAIWLKKDDDIKTILTNLFSSPYDLKNMKIRARLLAKKNSTKDICKVLLED